MLIILIALLVSFQVSAFNLSAGVRATKLNSGSQETPKDQQYLVGSVRLIETKQESEKAFQHDIVNRGLCSVVLTLTNESKDTVYSLQRSDITIRTEFDAQLAALEPQRAYDRLMWKVGSGPAFAEAGVIRAIGEGARKKKLQKSVLAAAIGGAVTLNPGDQVEGALFFEVPKDLKTLRFSTLVLGEVVNQKTGARAPLRLPLTTKP